MKIAVPTNDGLSISEPFGRSAGFLLLETEGNRIISRQLKENAGVHQHASTCAGHGGVSEPHNHAAIVSLIAGCDVVICAGMGARAAAALKEAGVREVIVTRAGSIEEQIEAYLHGRLVPGCSLCQCSH